jgi:hypothetical protein
MILPVTTPNESMSAVAPGPASLVVAASDELGG